MKRQALLNAALSLSLLGLTTLPVTANEPITNNIEPSSQQAVIPQSAAVIVGFTSEVTLDAGKDQEYPVMLLLTQPIYDSFGNAIARENSPVNARLKPTKDGIKIVAESVVIRGQLVPLQAESAVLPANTIKVSSGIERAKENSGAFGRLGASTFGAVSGGDMDSIKRGSLIGSAIGILSGMTSSQKVKVVKIAQGSQHILTLQTAVTLPFSNVSTPEATPVNNITVTSQKESNK